VPSALIPREPNYLLNPRQRDFTSLVRSASQPFEFDLRLLRLGQTAVEAAQWKASWELASKLS
jgi:hypothetical protein